MISLALSSSKLGSSPDTREVAANGEAKGANGAFSGVLAALTDQLTDIETEIAPAAGADLPAATGIALPVPAESGKILPDVAAGKVAEGLAGETADGDEPGDETKVATAAQAPAAPLPQLPVTAALPEPTVPAEAKPAQPSTSSMAATVFEGAPLPIPTAKTRQAKAESGEQAQAPSVTIHVAPEANTDAAPREPKTGAEFQPAKAGAEIQPARSREASAESVTPKPGSVEPKAASAEPATPVQSQSQNTSFASTLPSQAPQAGRTFEAARPALQPAE